MRAFIIVPDRGNRGHQKQGTLPYTRKLGVTISWSVSHQRYLRRLSPQQLGWFRHWGSLSRQEKWSHAEHVAHRIKKRAHRRTRGLVDTLEDPSLHLRFRHRNSLSSRGARQNRVLAATPMEQRTRRSSIPVRSCHRNRSSLQQRRVQSSSSSSPQQLVATAETRVRRRTRLR